MSPQGFSSSTEVGTQAQDASSSETDSDRLYWKTCEFEDVGFLPCHEFHSFTTQKAIATTLKSAGVSQTTIDKLISLIQNPDAEKSIRRIYLTLLRINKVSALPAIIGTDFSDVHLPLMKKVVASKTLVIQSRQQPSAQEPQQFFSRWSRNSIQLFIGHQSMFLAPVLEPDRFQYRMAPEIPLPLLTKEPRKKTGFSAVYQVTVPWSHIPSNHVYASDAMFALKELEESVDAEGERIQQNEMNVLFWIRSQTPGSRHLIRPIAAFTSPRKASFLFPWADLGNLRELWRKYSPSSVSIGWVLQQMEGVCGALALLASGRHRHSDLKPENLLCFSETDGITIKISDVGLSKFHLQNTSQRKVGSDAKHSTPQYSAPEFEGLSSTELGQFLSPQGEEKKSPQSLSRKFDVWSLGCVFLQFLTWFFSGQEGLETFDSQLRKMSYDKQFWSRTGPNGSQTISPMVVDQIKLLRTHHSLARMLDLIQHKMLVLKDYRSTAHEVKRTLRGIRDNFGDQTWTGYVSSSFRQERPEFTKLAASIDQSPPQSSDQGFSRQIVHRDSLLESLNEQNVAEFPQLGLSLGLPMQEDPNTGSSATNGALDTADASHYNEQSRDLKDMWIKKPDNLLARGFFSQMDIRHERIDKDVILCTKCSFLQIWRAGFEITRNVDEVFKNSSRCRLCTLLSLTARALDLTHIEDFRCTWEDSSLRVSGLADLRSTSLPIFLDPFSPGLVCPDGSGEDKVHIPSLIQSTQLGYPELLPSNSPEQHKLLKHWLHICDTQHRHSRDKTQKQHVSGMPTRLVYVGNSELRLHTSHSSFVRYTALSHRWGDGPPIRTLDSNLNHFRREIPFDLLPRNFQDAVKITRALGIEYLWIDSLCIIQENEQDWRREAARMGQVFSNAYCTIAASSATSSVQGFLYRQGRAPIFATLPGPGNTRLFVSESLENFHRDVERAPLNSRGWVFQERALSRRTLHFTKTQIYWECGSAVHSERLIKLINPQAALLGDSNFPESILRFYKGGRQTLFQVLYKRYSSLDFSHITDRSVACSGLEQKLAQTFKTRCSFGVFEKYLQRSLLWHRQDGSFLKRIRYPVNRQVPSWSWMAYKGPITYLDVPFDSVEWRFTSEELFGLTPARAGSTELPLYSVVTSMPVKLSQAESVDRVRFDENVTMQVQNLRCIVLGKDKAVDRHGERVIYVILIVEDPEQAGNYRRAGLGWLLDQHVVFGEKDVVLH